MHARVFAVSALITPFLLSTTATQRPTTVAADSTKIGIVVSHGVTRTPVEDAELRVNDEVTRYRSDYVGEISFTRARMTSMRIRLSKAGFTPVDTTFLVGNIDWMHIVLEFTPTPQVMAAAKVVAPPSNDPLAGFRQRMSQGRGHFITPETLRASYDKRLLDLLQRLPGLSHDAGTSGNHVLVSRRGPTSIIDKNHRPNYNVIVRGDSSKAGRGKTWNSNEVNEQVPSYCEVAVFLDGTFVQSPDIAMLRATGFDGVEFYSASNVPAEFRRPGTQCGAVLLWSR